MSELHDDYDESSHEHDRVLDWLPAREREALRVVPSQRHGRVSKEIAKGLRAEGNLYHRASLEFLRDNPLKTLEDFDALSAKNKEPYMRAASA